jgi:hypothetical protein
MADRGVKLLEFSGDPVKDMMTVMDYVVHVEQSRVAGGWTDGVTAEKVKLRLTGDARTWMTNRIRAGTEGMDAFAPAAVGNAAPAPGLRTLLITRFMPQQTAGEQERLRQSLVQGENESVHSFYDRVESIQFILDLEYPEAFRVDSKVSYDLVHDRSVRASFIAGLKAEIRKHVITENVATTEEALNTAIAFEKARAPPKTATVHAATTITLEEALAKLAAIGEGGGFQSGGQGGRGRLADEGCFYCGYLYHNKPDCNIRKKDEGNGIFQKRCNGYVAGRVGRGRGGRGGRGQGGQGQGRGGPRGGRGRGGYGSPFRGGGNGRGAAHGATGEQQQHYQFPPAQQPQPQQQQLPPQQHQLPIVPQPGYYWPVPPGSTGSTPTEMERYSLGATSRFWSPEN